jgi:hypothetical protein
MNLTPESRRKLERLEEGLHGAIMQAAGKALEQVAREYVVPGARTNLSPFRFEGDLERDMKAYPLHLEGSTATLLVGESGALLEFTRGDSVTAPDPWSYAWGKHDGIEPHRVYLYARDGGSGSVARQKLRRYAALARNEVIPDTKSELDALNVGRTDNERIPPFINVAPGSTPYLLDAARESMDTHFEAMFALQLRRRLDSSLR